MPFVQRVVNPIYISRTKKTRITTTSSSTAAVAPPIPSTSTKTTTSNETTTTTLTKTVVTAGGEGTESTNNLTSTCTTHNTNTNNTKNNNNHHKFIYHKNSTITTANVPVNDYELEAVTNLTLSNALRQLASLVLIANDIFIELNKELNNIGDRAKQIKCRIDTLEKTVDEFDPKLVTVPESDLATFVQIKNHFKINRQHDTCLFTPATRTENLQSLYEAAAKTPVMAMEEMDRLLGHEDRRSSDIFICTPVLGITRRRMKSNIDVEIETRMPAAVEELRKWTSTEAIGDITVSPDCRYNSQNCTTLLNNTITTQTTTQTSIITYTMNATTTDGGGQSGSPSIQLNNGPSNDVTDDITSSVTAVLNQSNHVTNEVTNDMPLDHRLPSPEEQCHMIALKYPAVIVKVDTSGRRFERMCITRKSMLNVPIPIGEHNNLNDDIQTVRRRSRSRKPKNKRRNTIAGTDHKEIEEAVKGDNSTRTTSPTITTNDTATIDKIDGKLVPRSKSSDVLKKDSPSSSFSTSDTIKSLTSRMSHFNTLKQWGKNRLRLINRNNSNTNANAICDTNGSNSNNNNNNNNDSNTIRDEQHLDGSMNNNDGNNLDANMENIDKISDIDEINVYETVISKNKRKLMEMDRNLSHERKPSYSSSEKSITTTSQSSQATLPASINPVKLRESSAIRRQRRSGLGHKDELNSSSGNWSASSESGRTSIGSELTAQPKSSASSTSLNLNMHHPGSGPPSSIISRRRFLNTSASSSVTSEGTVTPDLQTHDLYDDETSSAYSCDTEGYYTSFHVDSGLKTLKEEEPVTPLHTSSALSSTNSFGSSSNKTVLSAENEYELFGKGSTSTTASSAGTVCTTLMAASSDRSLINGPAVPERKSSLTKLNRSGSGASTCTLERSYSSSTVNSTLERTGTIKRNGILLKKEVSAIVHVNNKKNVTHASPPNVNNVIHLSNSTTTTGNTLNNDIKKDNYVNNRIESPDSGNNTSSSPIETNSNSSPTHGPRSNSEYEYSECSDLEGVERVERIRIKTTINSSRIPSLCVITPPHSDDDDNNNHNNNMNSNNSYTYNKSDLLNKSTKYYETNMDSIILAANDTKNNTIVIAPPQSISKTMNTVDVDVSNNLMSEKQSQNENIKKDVQHFKKTTLLPLNSMFGKLKGVLPHLKKSPKDTVDTINNEQNNIHGDDGDDGEYVTIADITNNHNQNNHNNINNNDHYNSNNNSRAGKYYTNQILKRNLATVLSGNLTEETEYVSLNELPSNIGRCESNLPKYSINSVDNNNGTVLNGDEKINKNIYENKGDFYSGNICGGNKKNENKTVHGDKEGDDNENDNNDDDDGNDLNKEGMNKRGARVTLDAHGKVIYNSDSLKRRKGAHTTFLPGPCVKDLTTISTFSTSSAAAVSNLNAAIKANLSSYPGGGIGGGGVCNRKPGVIRPVISQNKQYQQNKQNEKSAFVNNKQTDKIIIRADKDLSDSVNNNNNNNNTAIVRMPIATVIAASSVHNSQQQQQQQQQQLNNSTSNEMLGNAYKGAYVNVQDNTKNINNNGNHYNYLQKQHHQQQQQQQQDYQHLQLNEIHASENYRTPPYLSSTLPRISPTSSSSGSGSGSSCGNGAGYATIVYDRKSPSSNNIKNNGGLNHQTTNQVKNSNNNSMYWTLQSRNKQNNNNNNTTKKTDRYNLKNLINNDGYYDDNYNDDLNNVNDDGGGGRDGVLLDDQNSNLNGNGGYHGHNNNNNNNDLLNNQYKGKNYRKSIEALYSTPNKSTKKIKQSNLKSTPLGFSTYFSPISKHTENSSSSYSNNIYNNNNNNNHNHNSTILSPIDPVRNTTNPGTTFKTSTPSKLIYNSDNFLSNGADRDDDDDDDDALIADIQNKLFIQERYEELQQRSACSSPLNNINNRSGRSTPTHNLYDQNPRSRHSWASDNNNSDNIPQTCSDRLGTPKTSLMDFKRLLLSKAGKSPVSKPSAVEQLRLQKEALQKNAMQTPLSPPTLSINSSLNILDLSGSPKVFANRRQLRQGAYQGSPLKTINSGGVLTAPQNITAGGNSNNNNNNNNVGGHSTKHISPRSAWKYRSYRNTDLMSSAIPEVNSEEDSSSPNNSAERQLNKLQNTIDGVSNNHNGTTSMVTQQQSIIKENVINDKLENENTIENQLNHPKPPLSRSQLLQARANFLTNNGQISNSNHSTTLSTIPTKSIQQFKNSYPCSSDDKNSIITSSSSSKMVTNPLVSPSPPLPPPPPPLLLSSGSSSPPPSPAPPSLETAL